MPGRDRVSESHTPASRQVPSNYGPLRGANANARITGPCGDTMEIWLTVRDGVIEHATFTTDGCFHSMRCGSTAATMVQGASPEQAEAMTPEEVLQRAGSVPSDSEHCALLAVLTLRKAIQQFHETQPTDPPAATPAPRSAHIQPIAFREPPKATQPSSEKSSQRHTESPKEPSPQTSIQHKIVVLSGKGGVGKSTVATNLALTLAMEGLSVGLLDVDIHGPSIPTMLGLQKERVMQHGNKLVPVDLGALKVMSIGFLLGHPDDPIIWRGPVKMGIIQQFLEDVEWGELDFLIVDCPPGTGDEPLSICQLLDHPDGAIIVTTPQGVAESDVRKSVNFCFKLNLPVLGVVENMSGFICPQCGSEIDIFPTGAGGRIAHDFEVPLLGSIPVEPLVGVSGDEGTPFVRRFPNSRTAKAFAQIAEPILRRATPAPPVSMEG